jgi:beta-lactamase superfamily II metal-dependent hydrolase
VTNRVIVRASASAQSAQVGSLQPGEQLDLIGSVPNWHEVRLANGSVGFVSKRWTRVIAAGAPSAPPPPPPPTTPVFTIDVLDVGTGLGVLVRGPDFALVYDGGSNDDNARGPANRLIAYVKAIAPALTTIDHLILSHPHQDHVELLPDLLATYQVREVWDSGAVNNICGYRAFVQAIHGEPGVRYHNALQDGGTHAVSFASKPGGCYGNPAPTTTITLSLGSRIDESPIALGQNASMVILHADGGTHSSFNENSVVIRLTLGSTRVLLMGDAQAGNRADPSSTPVASSIEGVLLDCCVSDLAAQVLIVGHHGSKTSSRRAFLNAVSATAFVVSSGPKKYTSVVLPDHEVIDEITGRGEVFRTDVNDAACAVNPSKIGPVADGQPGGCDSVRIAIGLTGTPQVSFWHGAP